MTRLVAPRSLLKFRLKGGQQTYDLYRDAAGGVVTRQGGGLAYMGAAVVRAALWCIEIMDKGSAVDMVACDELWPPECLCLMIDGQGLTPRSARQGPAKATI